MAWFKVDDGFYSSKKVIRIPRAKRWSAVGLWLVAGTWCADNLTDGHIDHHELAELGGRVSDAESLVDAELWVQTHTGYLFHDWSDYQPTKAQVLDHRHKESERKRQFRASKGDTTPRPSGVHKTSARTADGRIAESGHPDPTRPDPTIKNKEHVHATHARALESEFAEWWKHYPRKQAKPDAFKAFKAARKDTSLEVLVAGVQAYKLLNIGVDKLKIKLPAGWLRDRRWEDEDQVAQEPSAQAWRQPERPVVHHMAQPAECPLHANYPMPCASCARDREEGREF